MRIASPNELHEHPRLNKSLYKMRPCHDWDRDRLSDVTAHLTNIPLEDIDKWVCRPPIERYREAEERGKIVRPMNSFMLYKRAYSGRVRVLLTSIGPGAISQNTICRITGASWKNEVNHIKQKYEILARIDRRNHSEAFPDYTFQTRKRRRALHLKNISKQSILPNCQNLEHSVGSQSHLEAKNKTYQTPLAPEVSSGRMSLPDQLHADPLLPESSCLPLSNATESCGLDQQLAKHEVLPNSMVNHDCTDTLSQGESMFLTASPSDVSTQGVSSHYHETNTDIIWDISSSHEEDPRSELHHFAPPSISALHGETGVLFEDLDPNLTNNCSELLENLSPELNLDRFHLLDDLLRR